MEHFMSGGKGKRFCFPSSINISIMRKRETLGAMKGVFVRKFVFIKQLGVSCCSYSRLQLSSIVFCVDWLSVVIGLEVT